MGREIGQQEIVNERGWEKRRGQRFRVNASAGRRCRSEMREQREKKRMTH